MNKKIKFCGKCDEPFADRFSFCPNCGGKLQFYEMNPAADPSNVSLIKNSKKFAEAGSNASPIGGAVQDSDHAHSERHFEPMLSIEKLTICSSRRPPPPPKPPVQKDERLAPIRAGKDPQLKAGVR